MENKKYFDNLDGLRAYAALAVIVFHQNVVFG
jgi:peptidoglycan/LPS O-acetylase OafA/YrhL